jgi:hypothetical protein
MPVSLQPGSRSDLRRPDTVEVRDERNDPLWRCRDNPLVAFPDLHPSLTSPHVPCDQCRDATVRSPRLRKRSCRAAASNEHLPRATDTRPTPPADGSGCFPPRTRPFPLPFVSPCCRPSDQVACRPVTPRTCRDHLAGEPPGLLAPGGRLRRRTCSTRPAAARFGPGALPGRRMARRELRVALPGRGDERRRSQDHRDRAHGERQRSRLCPGLTARVRTGASNAKDVAGPVRVVPGSGPEALNSRSADFTAPVGVLAAGARCWRWGTHQHRSG